MTDGCFQSHNFFKKDEKPFFFPTNFFCKLPLDECLCVGSGKVFSG